MISFNELGKLGRFGNQMFQYASLKGIATNNGYDFCIPPNRNLGEYNDHILLEAFDLKVKVAIKQFPRFEERMFNFDEDLFNNCPDNVNLSGFFQTEKYFLHIEKEIREDFRFKNKINHSFSEYVAIHIRRGDYITNSARHPVLPLKYYEKAMEHFGSPKDVLYVIFSDDPQWCQEQKLFNKCFYSDANYNNIDTMNLMSQASHNIIANSSFSWWAAWLNPNPNKIVICPETWFGPELAGHDISDIRPESWLKYENSL
jgi:hypothetical protein